MHEYKTNYILGLVQLACKTQLLNHRIHFFWKEKDFFELTRCLSYNFNKLHTRSCQHFSEPYVDFCCQLKILNTPMQKLPNKAVYTIEVNRNILDDSLHFIIVINLRHFQTHLSLYCSRKPINFCE